MAKKEKNTITVNEKEYELESLTDTQKAYLNHIQDLDRKLSNAQFNLDQLSFGREAFVQRLAESLETPPAEEIAAE
jgi:hypothetical protein